MCDTSGCHLSQEWQQAISATPRAVPISRKYLISDTLLGEGGTLEYAQFADTAMIAGGFASVMKGKVRDSGSNAAMAAAAAQMLLPGEPVAVKVIGDNVDCGPIKQEVSCAL